MAPLEKAKTALDEVRHKNHPNMVMSIEDMLLLQDEVNPM